MIGGKVIEFRPFRHEPRAQKKRPKSYSNLTKPRAEYKAAPQPPGVANTRRSSPAMNPKTKNHVKPDFSISGE